MDANGWLIVGTVAAIFLLVILYAHESVGDTPDLKSIGAYRGEDLHVRVMADIDLPVQYVPQVGPLDGDEDVAWAWGQHPSCARR